MPHSSQYSFIGALRLFSLAVALISCSLGILLGWDPSNPRPALALLLLAGGLLAQAGMNLINDVEDLTQIPAAERSQQTRQKIHRNKHLGWLAFGLAALIGAYLISMRGWPLFAILSLSAFLALNYNAGPLNFKHRGIAIVQVFILMGPVMVLASYYVMSGDFSVQALWLSLPVSLLISLLLLSNEIRDYEDDMRDRVRTFSTRIGQARAQQLYWLLIFAAVALVLIFAWHGWLNKVALILLPLALLPTLKHHLYANDKRKLTPLSGRFFLAFGVVYLLMLP